MSVVKSKRNESQYKYFVLARRIRREITIFSFENFYLKEKLEKYPKWWITNRRIFLDNLCSELMKNIKQATSIYPESNTDFEEKLNRIKTSIAFLDNIEEELSYMITILDDSIINRLSSLVENILEERKLLIGWKKKIGSLYKKFKGNI